MNFENLQHHNKKVLLVGDLILDEYIHGTMAGLSANGPIPVVNAQERTISPSCAGYAGIQLKSLGFDVYLCGLVGEDSAGNELINILQEYGINTSLVQKNDEFSTPKQTHISVQGDHYPKQDVLKVNAINTPQLEPEFFDEILASIMNYALDAIVITDRIGGLVSANFMGKIKSIAQKLNIPIIGDSENNLDLYKGFSAVTVNEQEAGRFLNTATFDVGVNGEELRGNLNCEAIFITQGAKGISVLTKDAQLIHQPTETIEVYDVSGAGETVLASVVAGLVNKLHPAEIGRLANLAAGIAVSKPGLAQVTMAEINAYERKQAAGLQADKLMSMEKLKAAIQKEQAAGKKIVWTNGCYDIMHVGHILYLEKARALGDALVVGLNSDASVKKSKGPNRPIIEENQRAKLLTSLICVDYVVMFDDQSPIRLIGELEPDIYAKGGDYTIDTINQEERRLVESYGGEISLLPGIDGMSTSHIIDRILDVYTDE
jgi:D-beta-D-heptose 7-phosphate kinase / D-beta-D-heptose 1-phosphate adenosyltransferase